MNRWAATLSMILTIAAALALPVAPVSAAPAPDYGASVKCRYAVTQPSSTLGWTEAQLRRLVVSPPTVYAQHGTQQIGWRFIVRRSLNWDLGPWKVTYRSPVKEASATTSSSAAFNTMRVDVTVPNVDNQAHVYYLVTLKVFWYDAQHSVESTASDQFDSYALQVGHRTPDHDSVCPGLITQAT